MIKPTKLSFDILNTDSCKTFGIVDTSYYSTLQQTANPTLQVITPFDDDPVEVDFYKNAVTIFNSNSVKITSVTDFDFLSDLPDGLYTAKLSICDAKDLWFEKSWYRTCLLECKYDKAFLTLHVNSCEACFSPDRLQKLERAKMYIYGCKVNAKNCNNKEAGKLYAAANKILDSLLECDCE